jgi:tetratricopeptide (TPR) repeat protein
MLDRANRSQEQGDLPRAADYLRRYLAFNPTDAEGLARYGLLLADPKFAKSQKDLNRAIQVLEKALFRDPGRNDLRRRVVGLAINLGLYARARDDIRTFLLPEFPQDSELQEMLGRCFERTGAYKDARVAYERSIRLAPTNVDTYATLARLLRRHPEEVLGEKETAADVVKKADGVMDEMVKSNDQSYRAYLLRAEDRRAAAPGDKKAADLAAADVARARELDPDATDVLLTAAGVELERDAEDKARELLQRALQLYPNHPQAYQALARMEIVKGRTDQAIAVLRDGLERLPNQLDLTWQLADVLTSLGHKDEAVDILARLERAGVPEADLACFRARLFMNERKWLDAIHLLEKAASVLAARSSAADESMTAQLAQQSNLLLGQCCSELGDYDRAAAAYVRVIVRDQRSIPGRLGLATTLSFLGRNVDALDQYRQVLRIPGCPAGVLGEIARLVLLRNLDRDEPRRDWVEVEKALADAAKAVVPPPVQLVVLQVEMHAAREEFDLAKTLLLEKYSDLATRPVEVWIALAALEERQGRSQEGMATLDVAEKYVSHSIDLRLARARHLARQDRDKGQIAMAKLAEGLDQFVADDRRRLLTGLGAIAMQSGDPALASQLWKQVAEELPNDLRCRIGLFDVAAQANDEAAMQRIIKQLWNIEGDGGVLWRYARASLLIAKAAGSEKDKSGLPEARSLLASVAVLRSYWARVALCQGRIDDLDNRPEAALDGYLRALRAGERDPLAFRRAVELLYERRRYNEAYDLMRRLPKSTLLPEELRRIGAELALYSHDGLSAVRLAKAAVDAGSKDFRDHLWLGRVYLAVGQNEEAGPAFVQARDLAPNEPDPWVAYVQFLAVTGQKERAQAEIDAAGKKLTGNSGRLALAYCYEAVGPLDRAKSKYEEALAAGPADAATVQGAASFYLRTGQIRAAQPLLERLTRELKTQSPDLANWARRSLAILLAVQRDPARTSEALALLASDQWSATSNNDAVSLQRTRATVLAMQNGRQPRGQAVEILEGLIESRTAAPDDYFLAAQLHEALNNWPKARQRFLALLDLPGGDSPAHLIVCARSLLRHNETEEARRLVAQVEKLDPKAFPTQELKARLLHADGKTIEAVTLIQSYAKGDNANLLDSAAVLTDIGDHSGAEELFRLAAERSRRPRESLLLAQFLIGRKRYAEALQICERVWTDAPPVAVAEVAIIALSEAPPDPQQFDRIERRLAESSKNNPEVVELLVALATVRNFQGRYDEAESLYRNAIAKNPRQGTALNNLAWLLALRGKGTEALELVRQATDSVGTDPGLLDTRGVANLALKQSNANEQAIKDLESATTEAASSTILFHLAQAYAAAGRRADATQAWRRAKLLGISAEVLHPLERPAYNQMAREFN